MHATTEQLLNIRDAAPVDSAVVSHVERCDSCSAKLALVRLNQQALLDLPTLAPSPRVFAQLTERLANEQRAPAPQRQTFRWAAAAAVVAAVALWMVPQDRLSQGGDQDLNQVAQDAPVSAPASSGERYAATAETSQPPGSVQDASTTDEALAAIVAAVAPWLVPQSGQLQEAGQALNQVAGGVPVSTAAATAQRNELMERSAALESVAEQLNMLGTAQTSSSTDEALAALEAQLALVDYNLSAVQIDQYAPAELNDLLARRVETLENIVSVQRAVLARQGYHGFQVMTASNIEEDLTW